MSAADVLLMFVGCMGVAAGYCLGRLESLRVAAAPAAETAQIHNHTHVNWQLLVDAARGAGYALVPISDKPTPPTRESLQ